VDVKLEEEVLVGEGGIEELAVWDGGVVRRL
jgi:hypothetical protein